MHSSKPKIRLPLVKKVLRFVLAGLMIWIGVMHFLHPEPFVRIVPDYLPAHLALVLISGFFEIAGGVGLLIPRTRRAAAWGLVALYVAVFPANINMAIHNIPFNENAPQEWLLWARLPLQIGLIAWAYWFTRRDQSS